MHLGLYGDGIFRYINKEVIDGFMLNNPKDGCVDPNNTVENIERKNFLDKGGLGSFPDQNIFQMNLTKTTLQEKDDQNYEEQYENEVNKAMQLVRNISDHSLNNEEQSRVKGESSSIFNFLFGFWFKRNKKKDNSNVKLDLKMGDSIVNSENEPISVDQDEFFKMKQKFMN